MKPSGVSKIVSFFSPFTDESVEIGNELEARGQSCLADAAGKLRTLAWMFFGIDRSMQHKIFQVWMTVRNLMLDFGGIVDRRRPEYSMKHAESMDDGVGPSSCKSSSVATLTCGSSICFQKIDFSL